MYKVFKNVINESAINQILKEHDEFKSSNLSFFRAQGTTAFERPKLDKFGNQRNSIQNPHLLGFSPGLMGSIRQLLYCDQLYRCMNEFSNSEELVHYQSMLFDKSTGTALHQDCWYLDTRPGGRLFGVWIALEDIEEKDGAFYVIENGPTTKVSFQDYNFSDIFNDEKFKRNFPNAQIYSFLPKKGDVLIWDSNTLHGAFMPTEEGRTRKSITGHYYPAGTAVMDQPIKRIFSVYNHVRPKRTANAKISCAASISPFLYNCICLFLYYTKSVGRLLTRDHVNNEKISEIRKI